MENIRYHFKDKLVLNFGKGVRTHPLPSVPKYKSIDYYHITKRGLGYIFDFNAPVTKSDGSASQSHLSSTSSWDSDYSIEELFNYFTIKMTFIDCL